MNKVLILTVIVLLGTKVTMAQRISPYQSGSYYPGLISLCGLIFLDYNYWMSSSGYYDKDGEKFTGGTINLPPPNNPINIDINPGISGYLNVPGLFYVSKFKVLGARYMASIYPIYLNLDYEVFMAIGDTSSNISGNVSGWGDLTAMPFGLSWSFGEKIDLSFMYTFYAPVGRYETGADDNLGQGFWTHQFQLPTYFYAMEQATALAIIPTFEFEGKVEDSEARTGNRFSLEYGISQYFTEWLEVEVVNGHNWQISDDSGSDAWWTGTRFDSRDRKNTFNAGVGVWSLKGMLNLRVKYIMDYGVRQRFKDNFVSLAWYLYQEFFPKKVMNRSSIDMNNEL
jgi:hypothetical protein